MRKDYYRNLEPRKTLRPETISKIGALTGLILIFSQHITCNTYCTPQREKTTQTRVTDYPTYNPIRDADTN